MSQVRDEMARKVHYAWKSRLQCPVLATVIPQGPAIAAAAWYASIRYERFLIVALLCYFCMRASYAHNSGERLREKMFIGPL